MTENRNMKPLAMTVIAILKERKKDEGRDSRKNSRNR